MPEALSSQFRAESDGIYLGRDRHGHWVWSGAERTVLVLGPPRSGKTTSIVIPNVIAATSGVVTTSTKPDVIRETAPYRREQGWVGCFDPTMTTPLPPGVHRIGWSPIPASRSWDGALAMSDAMVRAALRTRQGHANNAAESHWSERASALLSPLLHAAATLELPMRDLQSWVDRHDGGFALEVLVDASRGNEVAADVLTGIMNTDQREQSAIWSTASSVLAPYRSSGVLASTEGRLFDAGGFADGNNTLYICSPGRQQLQMAPLVVGLITEICDHAYARATAGEPPSPMLLALDEAANVAPLPDLISIVSEGASQGIVTMACLQDLSQARTRWGHGADGFFSLFSSTVVLPGIGDMASLSALSALGGERQWWSTTHSQGEPRRGRRQRSVSTTSLWRRRVDVEDIARGRPGQAMLLDQHKSLRAINLTPSYRDDPWRALCTPRARTAPQSSTELGLEHPAQSRER